MAPFRDRVALVTGAGSGIGAALAGVIAGVARNRVVPGLPPHARLLRWRSRVHGHDEVMSELDISRGNANMNIRALMDWGLVHKQLRTGERKEYFYAEKDMWVVVRQIILNRKKRELEPMLKVLEEISSVENNCPESESFCTVVRDIRKFSNKANQTLDALVKADATWLSNPLFSLLR